MFFNFLGVAVTSDSILGKPDACLLFLPGSGRPPGALYPQTQPPLGGYISMGHAPVPESPAFCRNIQTSGLYFASSGGLQTTPARPELVRN